MKKYGICIICFVLMLTLLFCPKNIKDVKAYNVDEFSNFTSSSYVLLDSDSGMVLVEKNSSEKMQVASICKLMTSLITLERIDSGALNLNDMITASEHACSMEGSQAFLDAGSEYSVADLLKSVIVASANDSAVVLAEAIGGSENAFVGMMNERAKELGMNNTVYANATGLPAPNQYSTALDTSIILGEVAKYDTYVKDSNIWMDKLTHPSGRETELVNTNRLIKYYDNCKTGKTGFTDEAGYCLASRASNGKLNLVAVVLKCDKAQDRFKESVDLYNYGFANFENVKIVDTSVDLEKTISVVSGKCDSVKIGFEKDFSILCKKGDKGNYSLEYELVKNVKAPFEKNTKVGVVTVLKDGKIVGEVNMVTLENVEKQNLVDVLHKISKNWALAK